MNGIEVLVNTPLPTIASVIVAVACLIGYYLFVLPLISENRQLKKDNKELEGKLDVVSDTTLNKLLDQNLRFNEVLQRLEADIKNNPDKAVEKIIQALDKLDGMMDKKDSVAITAVAEIRTMLSNIVEQHHGSKSRDDMLHTMMQELIRAMHNISDKQSQIIGALLGMSRIQDRNRPL